MPSGRCPIRLASSSSMPTEMNCSRPWLPPGRGRRSRAYCASTSSRAASAMRVSTPVRDRSPRRCGWPRTKPSSGLAAPSPCPRRARRARDSSRSDSTCGPPRRARRSPLAHGVTLVLTGAPVVPHTRDGPAVQQGTRSPHECPKDRARRATARARWRRPNGHHQEAPMHRCTRSRRPWSPRARASSPRTRATRPWRSGWRRIGLESTAELRLAYRELLLTSPGLADHVSGVILFDETIRQTAGRRHPVRRGARRGPGSCPASRSTAAPRRSPGPRTRSSPRASTGCRERLVEYAALGARFAKWRAVIRIGPGRPTAACIEANAHALARYAAAGPGGRAGARSSSPRS